MTASQLYIKLSDGSTKNILPVIETGSALVKGGVLVDNVTIEATADGTLSVKGIEWGKINGTISNQTDLTQYVTQQLSILETSLTSLMDTKDSALESKLVNNMEGNTSLPSGAFVINDTTLKEVIGELIEEYGGTIPSGD